MPNRTFDQKLADNWSAVWKIIISIGGMGLIFYEAVSKDYNLYAIIASMAMMGFPVARALDKWLK